MHELSIALNILDVVSEEVDRHGGRVTAIHLKLGPLSGVVCRALTAAFDLAREGTPHARSELIVEEVPVVLFCAVCHGERIPLSAQEFACPDCGTPSWDVVRGRELEVAALEIMP